MPERLSRVSLLGRGAALLGSGGALATLAGPAEAAVQEADLAYLRLLIAVELLKIDYDLRAASADEFRPSSRDFVRRLHRHDKRHYVALATLMNGAGQTPSTGGDFDFSYPRGSFASSTAIAKLGRRLATLATGAYLGALQKVQTPELRLPLARIAANEAQQAGAFGQLLGGRVVGNAFVAALPIDTVSAALDEYES